MLMPEGADAETLAARAAWLAPYCTERGYHFCPRRHIEWFGASGGRKGELGHVRLLAHA